MLEPRGLWSSAPPELRSPRANRPTLLFSWWCTGFATVIILMRLLGRKIRTNVLFREDWIMMLALIPLLIRMALIHVVLLYGTNNVQTSGLNEMQIAERAIGSRLVLGARIFYALFIWTSKFTVSEFLKRLTVGIWRRSYEITLHCIRVFLVITFVAVVIATLSECHPFDHYWQVVPDPGPHCRQGFAQLITMGSCDIITDCLLVAFPIPIVIRSSMPIKRKISLVLLFSLSLGLIGITATRVPEVIFHEGRQQYRTVWASCEILASAAVSNALILGSFVRDRGVKKAKYRANSMSDSIDRSSVRRPTITALQELGSDEDLFRTLGCRVPDHLQYKGDTGARLAPAALPAMSSPFASMSPAPPMRPPKREHSPHTSDSEDSLQKPPIPDGSPPSPTSTRRVSFFDIGGLLEDGPPNRTSRSTTVVSSADSATIAQDFAQQSPTQSRRGSRALLSDIGGLLSPTTSRSGVSSAAPMARRGSGAPPRHRNAPSGVLGPMLERQETVQSLQDAGGLLADVPSEAQRAPLSEVGEQGLERQETPLQDVGGLLSEERDRTSRSPGAPAARTESRTAPARGSASSGQDAAASTRPKDPDEMSFKDVGGLLGR